MVLELLPELVRAGGWICRAHAVRDRLRRGLQEVLRVPRAEAVEPVVMGEVEVDRGQRDPAVRERRRGRCPARPRTTARSRRSGSGGGPRRPLRPASARRRRGACRALSPPPPRARPAGTFTFKSVPSGSGSARSFSTRRAASAAAKREVELAAGRKAHVALARTEARWRSQECRGRSPRTPPRPCRSRSRRRPGSSRD